MKCGFLILPENLIDFMEMEDCPLSTLAARFRVFLERRKLVNILYLHDCKEFANFLE